MAHMRNGYVNTSKLRDTRKFGLSKESSGLQLFAAGCAAGCETKAASKNKHDSIIYVHLSLTKTITSYSGLYIRLGLQGQDSFIHSARKCSAVPAALGNMSAPQKYVTQVLKFRNRS